MMLLISIVLCICLGISEAGKRNGGTGPKDRPDIFTKHSDESAEDFSGRVGPQKLSRVNVFGEDNLWGSPDYEDSNFVVIGEPVEALWNKTPVIIAYFEIS